MRPSEALFRYRSQIREIALRHRVSSVRVFGSALHGDDTADSDLDLLVEPTAQTTLMDIGAIRFELLIRPCEVLSRVANVTILEVANNALRVLLQHRHVIIGSLA